MYPPKLGISIGDYFRVSPEETVDPIAEAEVYSNFNKIVGDKTAIYISHRLSSCRFCDKIAVFDRGSIVQVGTHDELVADVNGKYHELWNAQAQYYSDKKEDALCPSGWRRNDWLQGY